MEKIIRNVINKNIFFKTVVFLLSAGFLFLILSPLKINAQCLPEECPPYLIISKSVDKMNALPGEQIVYTLNYRNIGNSDATGVVVKDTFNYINQTYLTFVSANPSPSIGTDTWNIGTLSPGQTGQISIIAKISLNPPIGTTEIKNKAFITSTQTFSQSSNCISVFVTKAGNPTLTISKTVSAATATAGNEIVYTLNYQNTGAGPASNVTIADPFTNSNQNYLSFVSANPAPTANNNTWNVGTLNPGQSGQITITAKIANSLPLGTFDIKNRATIDSDETFLVFSNFVSTSITSTVSLSISKLAMNVTQNGPFLDSINAFPSERVAFSITITNSGNIGADNVYVSDGLPYQLKYVAGSTKLDGSAIQDITTSGGISIGTVNAGQSKVVTFLTDVASANNFVVGNTTLINTGQAWRISNYILITDRATVIVTKSGTPTISITKSVNKTSAIPSDNIIYTLNYKNTGLSNATNVVITDSFTNLNQNYLTFVSATPSPSSGNNTWNIGTLSPGQTGQIVITAKINNSVPTGTTEIKNQATIDSGETTTQNSNFVSIFVNSTAILTINKQVRDITKNSSFASSTTSDPGDEIEFSLNITTTGSDTMTNVKVWDTLPSRLQYIAGSTTVNGSSTGDGVINAGINIGNVIAGAAQLIKFRATLDPANMFNVGTTVLTNYGYANADSVAAVNSSATINVGKATGCSPSIQINKLARNITQGMTYFADSIYAKSGDEVEFSIKIVSVGNETAQNTRVRDQVPSYVTYLFGSTTVDGVSKNDDIISSGGLSMGNLTIGASREIKFRAKVNFTNTLSAYTVTNTAYSWADKTCSNISDTANLILSSGSQTSNTTINLDKTGRNITKNQSQFLNSFLADPGNELEFLIQVSNTGNTNINNVRVWDNLPVNVLIIPGSTTVDGVNWGGDINGAGIGLLSLNAGQIKTIKFRATVAAADKFGAGSTTLVNTGFVSGDNVSQLSDQVSIIIYRPGEVLGVGTVVTGSNYLALTMLFLLSVIMAFIIYCFAREEKLLDDLNNRKGGKIYRSLINLYFRTKLILKVKTLKFRKIRS